LACKDCSRRTSRAIFVTLAAGFVYGLHGTIGKILALPEFISAVAVARLVGAALTARRMPTLTILLVRAR
jgi:hypothetical protein